jgi:hypothetical protein
MNLKPICVALFFGVLSSCSTTKNTSDSIPPEIDTTTANVSVRQSGESVKNAKNTTNKISIYIDRSLSLNEQIEQLLNQLETE